MATSKTSEARAKVSLDSAAFEKGAKAIVSAANAMSVAVTAAFATAGVAVLAAFGAEGVNGIVSSVKSVIKLGEEMANAGKKAGLAAGQFYLFHNAIEKGLSLKTVANLIGENAAVLNRSANVFRDVAIKLWVVGEKIRGFWLGLVDRVAPVLSRILDGALGASLVEAGQMFGETIAEAMEAVYQLAKDGNLWDSFKDAFKIAFDYAEERLVSFTKIGFDLLREMVSFALTDGVETAFQAIWKTSKDFTSDFAQQLGDALFDVFTNITEMVYGLLNTIEKGLAYIGVMSDADAQRNAESRAKDIQDRNASESPSVSHDPDSGENFIEKVGGILKDYKFQPSDELTSEISKFSETVGTALSKYNANEKESPTRHFENNTRRQAFGADSLAAIGAGGNVYVGLNILDINRAQLTELREINQKLGDGRNASVTNQFSVGATTPGGISRAQTRSVISSQ